MSNYTPALYTALGTVISAVWPEVLVTGIYEAEHIEMIPWADLTPPYAVIVIDNMPEADWGLNNIVYQPQIGVYWVGETAGKSTTHRAKLEAARDAFLAATLSTGQVMSVKDLSWSNSLLPNQVFIAKDYTHRAGRLIVDIVVGEIYGT